MSVVFALDSWDRQLVAAAKSEGDRLLAIRTVWGQRVGMSPDAVPMGALVRRLAEIVQGCGLADLTKLLEQAEYLESTSEEAQPVRHILDAIVKGDFETAKAQAKRSLERVNLLPKANGTSSFTMVWFWVLVNTIQSAPRDKFAMVCTAEA